MSKRLPSIVLFLIAGALLVYTASQTLNLLKVFLPPEQAPLAYLALVAFDGGLLGWSYFFAKGARGGWQRSIAAIMIVVSIVAVVIGFGAETFFTAAKKGMLVVTPDMATTVVWSVCGVIAANVVAIVVTHLTSPEHRREMAEEEANDVIEDAVIRAIKQSAPITARHIAPHKVTEWVEDRMQMYLPAGQTMQALPAPQQQQKLVEAEPEKKPTLIDKAKQLFGMGETEPEPATFADTAPLAEVKPAQGLKQPLPRRQLLDRDTLAQSGFSEQDITYILDALKAKQEAQPSDPSTAPLNQDQATQ